MIEAKTIMKYDSFPLIEWYEGKDYSFDLSESGIMNRDFKESFFANHSSLINDYGSTCGEEELLCLLSEIYKVKKDQILITNGATEAIYLSLECVLNPCDELIIATPYYNNIGNVLKKKGVVVKECFFKFDSSDNYIESLINQVTLKTKAILVCSIFNPSGFVISKEDYRKLISFTKANDIHLIFDDVFAEFELHKHDYFLNYQETGNIIHINGMAKVYGAPGLRIGWAVSSQSIIRELIKVKGYVSENAPRLSQVVSISILKDRNKLLRENDKYISQNRELLVEFCNSHSNLHLYYPKGGCCCLINYKWKINSYDLCNSIYSKTGILLAPGDALGYANCIRMGFGISTNSFIERIDRLNTFLNYFEETNEC